ncbi:MAG: hypothetical protein HKN09_10615 [Saprospiraceae bacterium]|nr:hypothetical protein [Saprospiraceae bacterium]
MTGEARFHTIAQAFVAQHEGVILAKMMSSPGLKFNDKVFAFYHKDKMGFRLGTQFNLEANGIANAEPLSPFKTKPPLKGWFMIDVVEADLWPLLTEEALKFTQSL